MLLSFIKVCTLNSDNDYYCIFLCAYLHLHFVVTVLLMHINIHKLLYRRQSLGSYKCTQQQPSLFCVSGHTLFFRDTLQ